MNIALTLILSLFAPSMQSESKGDRSFSGLIEDKALPKLEKPASATPFGGTTFSYGVFTSQKTWSAFSKRAGKPVEKLEVDWKTEIIVYVVLQKHSNRLSFQKWEQKSDKTGELLIQWIPIKPLYTDSVPGVFYPVSKKDLDQIVVKFSGFGGQKGPLGTIKLKP